MPSPLSFAILGRQPELGLVELESVLGRGTVIPFGRHALLNTAPPTVDRLGGSLKLGRIIARLPKTAPQELAAVLDLTSFPEVTGKLTFGLSWYGPGATARQVSGLGLELKKRLKAGGQSVRCIAPNSNETALNAAQFKFNNIAAHGFELIIISDRSEFVVGIVEGVQDVDAYAARDHGRPARSAKVGMLPPKLAQILVNTTHGAQIHDPFCGTGVILQEALLLGRRVTGSDLEPEMIEASVTNLNWLTGQAERNMQEISPTSMSHADATKLVLPAGTESIVSEGYLGPNLSTAPAYDELARIQRDLLALYRASLKNWATQLPSGAEVSICAPAWRMNKHWEPLNIVDEATRLGYTTKVFETVPQPSSAPIIYGRDDQQVGRALILLTKV